MTVKFFRTLKAVTPQGEFTRGTATPYSHAVVRHSPRAQGLYQKVQAGDADGINSAKSGAQARWVKDRGFVVSWHTTEKSALSAAASTYGYDPDTTVLGIYPVTIPAEAQTAA
jgi:hypothetical protein